MHADPASTYADSPERMLVLAILFMFAVALLILSSHYMSRLGRSVAPAARPLTPAAPKLEPAEDPAG
jgi:hypothetical protein